MTYLFTTPEVEVTKRMLVYDLDNFFADFGGFLGLFLGASCFTIVDVVTSAVERFIDKKRRQKLVTVVELKNGEFGYQKRI